MQIIIMASRLDETTVSELNVDIAVDERHDLNVIPILNPDPSGLTREAGDHVRVGLRPHHEIVVGSYMVLDVSTHVQRSWHRGHRYHDCSATRPIKPSASGGNLDERH